MKILFPNTKRALGAMTMLLVLWIIALPTKARADWNVQGTTVAGDNWTLMGNWSIAWDINYNSSRDTTNYSYTLTDLEPPSGTPNNQDKNLSHWDFTFESCVTTEQIESVNPTTGYEFLTAPKSGKFAGFWGIKWDTDNSASINSDGFQTFSIVFSGEVAPTEDTIRVKAGNTQDAPPSTLGMVPGCGAGPEEPSTYQIEGRTFIDVNGNGQLDVDVNGHPIEPVVSDINVSLDGNASRSTVTGANGDYLFKPLNAGSYTVSSPSGVDYNGDGVNDITLTTPNNISVTLPPNATIDFGYTLNICLECGMVAGEGRTIGFWKHQLSVILKGKGRAQIKEPEMATLIYSVHNFFLMDPYVLMDSTGTPDWQAAYSYLSFKGSDGLSLMLKQLLAAELNSYYSSLVQEPAVLVDLILMTAESMAYMEMTEIHSFPRDELLTIKDLLDQMNNLGH